MRTRLLSPLAAAATLLLFLSAAAACAARCRLLLCAEAARCRRRCFSTAACRYCFALLAFAASDLGHGRQGPVHGRVWRVMCVRECVHKGVCGRPLFD